MFHDVTSVTLHSALDGLSLRKRVIADNVANINTPGFLAGKVQFEEALAAAVREGSLQPGTGPAPATTARSLEPTREDGNNVNLDRETLDDIETGLRYSLALRAVDSEFALLRSSMRTHG